MYSIVTFFFSLHSSSDDSPKSFYKILDDDNSRFTNVGNIGLTVTNFGTYGHGFSLWPEQPSCEFPLGSGIEHMFDGGLWIGAFVSDDSLDGANQAHMYLLARSTPPPSPRGEADSNLPTDGVKKLRKDPHWLILSFLIPKLFPIRIL